MAATSTVFLQFRAAHLRGVLPVKVKEVVRAGELDVTSGGVVACDPLVQPGRPGFVRRVPAGRYAVYLYVTRAGEVGFAELRLRATPVVRLEMATLPGQDVATLGASEFFGYSVDSGIGCLADREAMGMLRGDLAELYAAEMQPAMAANGGAWARLGEIFVVRAGDGDGVYATYFGIDDEGEVACVVTSFRVFAEPMAADRKLQMATERFAELVGAVEAGIGAVLRGRGFVGPDISYKPRADAEMRLVYAREGLMFEVEGCCTGPDLLSTAFRWARGPRQYVSVGQEHAAASIDISLPRGLALAVGSAGVAMAREIGTSYARHWEVLERAVLALLPVKAAKRAGEGAAAKSTAAAVRSAAKKAAAPKTAKKAKKAAAPKTAKSAVAKRAKSKAAKSTAAKKAAATKTAKSTAAKKAAAPKTAKSAAAKKAAVAKMAKSTAAKSTVTKKAAATKTAKSTAVKKAAATKTAKSAAATKAAKRTKSTGRRVGTAR